MLAAELKNVAKVYGDCWANREVNLRIRPGTIHGLIGENGAGKSTAMKILFGLVQPSSGEVLLRGKPCLNWSPKAAFDNGVGMVHQHFMLAHSESVLDNLVLGVEHTRFGFRDRARDRAELEKLMKSTGLEVDLDAKVGDLPVSYQSRCEILKVLYRKAEFLILDEPTAVLTPLEVESFLETLRKLRTQGKTILIVTHKLREIMAVADEATVMRQGRTVGLVDIKNTSVEELTEMMIGRKLSLPRAKKALTKEDAPRLSVKRFGIEVRPGEIVGIAGIEGNGQEEILSEVLKNPVALRQRPVAIMPPDRHRDAMVLQMTLSENLALGRRQAKGENWPKDRTLNFLKNHDVRPANPDALGASLSGGNQQKLVVARELDATEPAPELIVAAHPTRGVDLGAIEQIHGKILKATERGAGCLLVSSELEELMNLSHRIGVVYKGKLAHWFEPPYSEHAIGRVMLTGETQ